MDGDEDQLAAIRVLHHELTTFEHDHTANLETLFRRVEEHIDAFRRLLDKPSRNDASRQKLASGKIQVGDEEYEVNDDFKNEATQLSDLLDLDQVQSAGLLLRGTEEAKTLDRTPLASALIRFHSYRSFLLESLRILFKFSLGGMDPEDGEDADIGLEKNVRMVWVEAVTMILGTKQNPSNNGSPFAQKCIAALQSIEGWLRSITDQLQKTETLGQARNISYEEIMGIQQENLTRQHETLSIILANVVNGNYAKVEDFQKLLGLIPHLEHWNVIAVHYTPALIAFCKHFGSEDANIPFEDCYKLHKSIRAERDSKPWALRNFHAAFMTWWLVEFNSWFFESPAGPDSSIKDPETEREERSDMLQQALREGGFHTTLSICSQAKSSEWDDPARAGLIRGLLHDTPSLPFEPAPISSAFLDSVMEAFQSFTDGFVTYMPDVLRNFKHEEDEKRRRLFAGSIEPDVVNNDRHLERFFVIMSFVYEGRPEGADVFWLDSEGNMYGFLQWFSRRVSTPLMGAFCEMFRSISTGEEFATRAHNFLLDEGPTSSSRIRRTSSLSWAQIFEELEYYAAKIREGPNAPAATGNGKNKAAYDDADEPETPIMLECYLRLITHLATQSSTVRQWILNHPTFKFVENLFTLSNNTVPSSIRAWSYSCLRGLLAEKSANVTNLIWTSLDQWISNGFSAGSSIPRPVRVGNASTWAEDITFEAILASHDESNSFVSLLQALFQPSGDAAILNDALPFPEELGSSYRMPGVEPYVDFVLGKLFATKFRPSDHGPTEHRQRDLTADQLILASNVLGFVQTCLETFNENLIILANRSGMAMDSLIGSSTLTAYVQMHPFSRVMEWMFNDRVLLALFRMADQDITKVTHERASSPVVMCVKRAVDVINLIMNLQSTYLDVVHPLLKSQSNPRRNPVSNPALVCFEDAVATHLRIIANLGYYAGSGHKDLALASLELLKQFAASRKLNASHSNRNGSHVAANKLVGALQQLGDIDPIAISMSQSMGFDDQEIAQEHVSNGFDIKFATLEFLDKTLSAHPDQPNVAHALLGFECVGASVRVGEDSLFANGSSLFHVITKLSIEYPEAIDGSMRYWCLSIKTKANSILRTLWSSPLTSAIVLEEMKEAQVPFWQWAIQSPIDQETMWEDQATNDPIFTFLDGAAAFQQYLRIRSDIYELAASLLRRSAEDQNPTFHAQVIATLLGSTIIDDSEQENPNVFQLADFMELEVFAPADVDFQIAREIDFGFARKPAAHGQAHFDLALVEQLLTLRRRALRRANLLEDEGSEQRVEQEIRDVLAFFNAFNNYQAIVASRLAATKDWCDLVVVLVQSKELEPELRVGLTQQALQLILPKLESSAAGNRPDVLLFASLAQSLLSHVSASDSALTGGHAADAANDRLFGLFKIALKAITSPNASSSLRAILYNVAYRYLATLFGETQAATATYLTSANQAVRVSGYALIDILCDDILDAQGATRVSSQLLLASLTRLADREGARHVLDALVRSNFLVVLVETVADMPEELRAATPAEVPGLVQGYRATLALLLTVAQARSSTNNNGGGSGSGAAHVLNAGLFAAIRQSGLFAADPDIGLEATTTSDAGEENPGAGLRAFYELLAGVLRIIVAVVVSRGAHNGATVEQARQFLDENRLSMVGVLKRRARAAAAVEREVNGNGNGNGNGLNGVTTVTVDDRLEDVVELFVLLTNLTGFVEYEEALDSTPKVRAGRFT